MSERNLTSGEINMLSTVYGNSIDYSKITLDTRTIPNSNATTTFNTISFPTVDADGNDIKVPLPTDFSSIADIGPKAWLVHEVAHIWQWQVEAC